MADPTYSGTKDVQQMYVDKKSNQYYKLYPRSTAKNIILDSTNSIDLDDLYTVSGSSLKIKSEYLPVQVYPVTICSTSASMAIKTVTIDNFNLTNGVRLLIKFTNANTAENPKLKINSLDAVNITYHNNNVNKEALNSDDIYDLVYNGTSFEVLTEIANTYYGGTSSLFYVSNSMEDGGSSTNIATITIDYDGGASATVASLTEEQIQDGGDSSDIE